MRALEGLRKQIDEIDALIIENLAKRQELSKQIGQLKSNHSKDIVDPLREETLFAHYRILSERYQIQANFIKDLFKLIIAHSKKVQKL
jgi:chorismate mutase